jgi:hypothetical protein
MNPILAHGEALLGTSARFAYPDATRHKQPVVEAEDAQAPFAQTHETIRVYRASIQPGVQGFRNHDVSMLLNLNACSDFAVNLLG